ncbi:MAG: TM1266 family iron-only hydrogenase system putative regulator [Deltaproteobacteria bacterium]
MEKEISIVGIFVEDRRQNACKVNDILTSFGSLIVGRLGIPYEDRNMSIISIIVDAKSREINEMTSKLSDIDGVKVMSMQG